MSNRRTPTDVDSAIPSSGSSEQLQDNHPRTQAHSLSSSSAASFHQSTSAPATTGDHQWFPPSHQMIVTSSSFYDPTQASGFTAQQPTMNVWDTQFTGPGGDYFPRQHTTYQQPYHFEGAATNQYSFAQDQVQRQQHSQPRSAVPAARRSARGSARPSGYYRQGGAQSQQYSQVPPSVPPNPPSAQPPPQPSQQPTGQALAAQRTTQLIAGQFSPVQAEQQYPAQQPQPHFSPPPPPTQSQFQIQQTQFPPTPQFSQGQPQPRPQSQFSQPHHPHVPTQSHAHSHVSTHAQSQPQVHTPPNPPQQSQHYSGPSDSYYLQGDMYYAMNTQGSRSTPSLHSQTQSTISFHSTHAPSSTTHAHSLSPHTPFTTFGPRTPPTPSSDGGPLLGLPRSHDSVSPASYASHPTSSSFEDSSSGHPASSASSGIAHMTSQGMGHAATSSVSTVTPGSPPTVAAPQQQQQQRVQIRQRPIMPITAATTTTAQAGPARPPIVPKPPAPRPATNRRARAPKRPRPSTSQGGGGGGDSDDDSDDDDVVEWTGPSMPPQGAATAMPGQRKTGACTHCKRLKMKCDFPDGASTCKRCATGGHPCIVEGRKPRTAPNKREYLLAQIRHKDQIIESLLKQLHNPYLATPLSVASFKAATSPSDSDNMNIVDWLDRLQASTKQPGMASPTDPNFLRNLRNPSAVVVDDSEDDDPDAEEDPVEEDVEKVRNSLPDAAVPIGLLANLSLDKDKDKGKGRGRQGGNTGAGGSNTKPEDDDDNVGVANKEYFLPGPASNLNIRKTLVEQHTPEIVLHGLVNNTDVEKLFDIFWKQINPFIGLLDPTLHTSQSIFQRCPFLFTVICAISSRYYKEKSEIYPVAMHFAKHSAANALIDGWKSVELCQAYILMSIYAVPARRWEEDRSWLYTGLAARIATDLNLHQVSTTQPQTERQEREMLNRTRVWMICFNIDRSTATQFGKPSTIKEDYITRHSADWYKQSRFRDKFDIHLCAYSTLLRIVGRFHDDIFSDPSSPTGLNKSINFLQVTLEHDRHLTNYFEEWTRRFNEESDPGDPGSIFRCTLLPFLVSYSRLVMYSFGFQHAFQRGMEASDNVFLDKCFDSAKVVIKQMIEVLAPSGLMRAAPDGHFVFASFASAFMLKLLRPEFAQLLTRQMEDEIFELIGRLITTLQDVAIDERHTPRLYARFLASLLTRHRKGGGSVGGRLQHAPPQGQVSRQPEPRSFASQPSSSSGTRYSGGPAPGMSQQGRDSDSMQMTLNRGTSSSPSQASTSPTATPMIYSEAAYSRTQSNHGVLDSDMDVGMADVLSESGTLAAMHALNDAWWSNMMMPGFSWPEGPHLNGVPEVYNHGIPGIHPSFGGYTAEPQLAM